MRPKDPALSRSASPLCRSLWPNPRLEPGERSRVTVRPGRGFVKGVHCTHTIVPVHCTPSIARADHGEEAGAREKTARSLLEVWCRQIHRVPSPRPRRRVAPDRAVAVYRREAVRAASSSLSRRLGLRVSRGSPGRGGLDFASGIVGVSWLTVTSSSFHGSSSEGNRRRSHRSRTFAPCSRARSCRSANLHSGC